MFCGCLPCFPRSSTNASCDISQPVFLTGVCGTLCAHTLQISLPWRFASEVPEGEVPERKSGKAWPWCGSAVLSRPLSPQSPQCHEVTFLRKAWSQARCALLGLQEPQVQDRMWDENVASPREETTVYERRHDHLLRYFCCQGLMFAFKDAFDTFDAFEPKANLLETTPTCI